MFFARVDVDGELMLVSYDGQYRLRTHDESEDCAENGCVIHNPTMSDRANREDWPLLWREDRGIMERICPHGVGHPDMDSARFYKRQGQEFENVHGCDGCCWVEVPIQDEDADHD
jgi:hypothetical protein